MFRKRIQLGLIHMAVAMTLVPINSTLNRVMIKDLGISATLVALLASLPYLISPIQVAIGSFADRHALQGYRRTPYIALGLLLCVIGVVLSPYAAYLMADNFWFGLVVGLIAFGSWGMGYNLSAVSYMSLASEISGENGRSRTIAIMFIMMIVGIILTSIALSRMLETYSPETLAEAFRVIGLVALLLGMLGLVLLEDPQTQQRLTATDNYSWTAMMYVVIENRQVKLFFIYLIILLIAILGQDILLEPYAAEAFSMPVQTTTRITSIWGACFLLAMLVAGLLEGRVHKLTLAKIGGWNAMMGFILISSSGLLSLPVIFYTGLVVLGIGTGLSTVSNLSLMLDMTTASKVGLYIGIWGMANAISRLLGSMIGGALRDALTHLMQDPIMAYVAVFMGMGLLILISLWMLSRINVSIFRKQAEHPISILERATLVE
ncbi:MAG: PUCC protein [Chloroflexi bacterium RBG_13_50_21]|nr:MAG: PUCC protein [Chloroflexi bacterium RBG_13_50_21]OGO62418.1 MAG: PUCC protein [Chloroflexi bacterium RBG_19FT_COMBO_47_9]